MQNKFSFGCSFEQNLQIPIMTFAIKKVIKNEL